MSYVMRATLTVVLASLATASALAAFDESIDCAEFITSQVGDEPVSGELCGGYESLEFGERVGHPWLENREVVGYYRLTTGEIIHLDCETYEEVPE